jgi:hypothetical protein
VYSDDESRQPGGGFARGRRGEIERRGRATYRHGEESKRARIKAGFIVERVYCTGVTPARETAGD